MNINNFEIGYHVSMISFTRAEIRANAEKITGAAQSWSNAD